MLVLTCSPVAQQKPVVAPEKVLDAYEAAIRREAAPNPVCYHTGFDVYVGEATPSTHWRIEGYFVEDGRFKERVTRDTSVSQYGYDGKRYWETSNERVQKPGPDEFERLTKSREISMPTPVHLGLDFFPPSRGWRNSFVELKILGRSKVDKYEVIVVRAKTRTENSINLYYDSKDFLLRRADLVAKIEKGTGEKGGFVVSRYFRKYSERGGWMIPGEIYDITPEYTVRKILTTFELNPTMTEETFQRPR